MIIERLITAWRKFTSQPIRQGEKVVLMQEVFANYTISIMLILLLIVFGIINMVIEGKIIIGSINFGYAFIVLISLIHLAKTQRFAFSNNVILTSTLILLPLLLLSGGIANTGLFWFFFFPQIAFFLTGQKRGLLWITVLVLISASVVALDMFGIVNVAFSWVVLRQFGISFIAVTIITFFIMDRIEYDQDLAKKKTKILLGLNEKLSTEITDRQDAEDNLKTKTAELERLNTIMIGREVRMAELKQENQELKERIERKNQ
jgi:hypothetical protein